MEILSDLILTIYFFRKAEDLRICRPAPSYDPSHVGALLTPSTLLHGVGVVGCVHNLFICVALLVNIFSGFFSQPGVQVNISSGPFS